MNRERLLRGGIDYDVGLSRFLDDRELYEAVLASFLEDDAFDRAAAAFAARDDSALFAAAHELKGSCGNVDMTRVSSAAATLVELLRPAVSADPPGPAPDPAALERAFVAFRAAADEALGAIREARETE